RKHGRRPERFNPTASSDPLAGLGLIYAGLYLREKILKVGNAFQVQRHLAKANTLQMLMSIGHPRQRGGAVQVDDTGGWAFIALRSCVRADEDNAIAFGGDGFSSRL